MAKGKDKKKKELANVKVNIKSYSANLIDSIVDTDVRYRSRDHFVEVAVHNLTQKETGRKGVDLSPENIKKLTHEQITKHTKKSLKAKTHTP